MKYGLMSFNYTVNVGNEIQAIAARRFLPKIDYYIDHEKLERFDEDKDVKMIMNAWYLDCPKAWPPSENIDPLLVSMHFTKSKALGRRDAVISPKSKEFFEKNGPVGCRDMHTVNFLIENDIDAYFTGCLTLTLDSGLSEKKACEDYIVVNHENPHEIVSFLKEKTDKKIYWVYQNMHPSLKKAFPETMGKNLYNFTSFYSCEEKFQYAENLLKIYENASCVITDRLHCALPSLAFKTPVLLLQNNRMTERYDGLNDLMHKSTPNDYKTSYSSVFDVENPPENPKNYLKIRKDLIERCMKFTGHINKSCYSDATTFENLIQSMGALSRNSYELREYMVDVLEMAERYEDKISKQNETIKQQKQLIEEMKSSNSWKMTSPMRGLKNKFKR